MLGLKGRALTQLAVVRDLREYRPPASAEELEDFEVDVLSGFVLARSSAGVTDGTIRVVDDSLVTASGASTVTQITNIEAQLQSTGSTITVPNFSGKLGL